MNGDTGRARWVGVTLAAASAMALAGFAVRPVLAEQNFRFEEWHLAAIAQARGLWIVSYQLLVFGFFLRLAGFVALATLVEKPGKATLLWPAVAMAASASLVGALAAGYAMHTGFWGADQWAVGRMNTAWLEQIRPLDEWMVCVSRMSRMFLSFALIPLGLALHAAGLLPRTLARAGSVLGAASMAALFVWPFSTTSFVPFELATNGWLTAVGVCLALRGVGAGQGADASVPAVARQEA